MFTCIWYLVGYHSIHSFNDIYASYIYTHPVSLAGHFGVTNAILCTVTNYARWKSFGIKFHPKSKINSKYNNHIIINQCEHKVNILQFSNMLLTLSLQCLWDMNMRCALTSFSGNKEQSFYRALRWMHRT